MRRRAAVSCTGVTDTSESDDPEVGDDHEVRDGVAGEGEDDIEEAIDGEADAGTEVLLAPVSDPIATARRLHGARGALLAAGMFGIDVALGRKPREDVPVVVAANDEPIDIDTEGIAITLDDNTSVVAPALPRSEPQRRPRRSRRSRTR